MAKVRECTRPWGNGGLEPRSCSRPARDGADLDVLALVDQLARPSIRPTSWRSARNRRARTVVEALEVVGAVSLGTVPAGTTEAQVDDMILVLEVAGEATPAPKPA